MEIQLWHEILCPYELAVQELVVKFRHLIKEHRELDLYSPIEQVTGRVKSVSSILEKLQRKKIPFERLEEEVEDIAGIRIICQFVEDIEKVAELIAGRSDMEIKSEKDYIRNMKPSGYRSYHLIVYYTVETLKGPKRLQENCRSGRWQWISGRPSNIRFSINIRRIFRNISGSGSLRRQMPLFLWTTKCLL